MSASEQVVPSATRTVRPCHRHSSGTASSQPRATRRVKRWITVWGILARARQSAPVFVWLIRRPQSEQYTATRITAERQDRWAPVNSICDSSAHSVMAGV